MVAEGMTLDEILADFPQLTLDDIHEALRYAAAAVDERVLPLPPVELDTASTSWCRGSVMTTAGQWHRRAEISRFQTS
ncbi:MAG: DUF433 domain-containing protein [Acidimicrobiales bacterium]